MKRVIMIIAVLLFVVACSKDEQISLFDKTATERMAENKDEFYKNLNSGNWVIELFPRSDQGLGGFSIAADFNEDYTATLWNELGDNTNETTSYDIVNRDGSTLTFNGYNNGIHTFSNPTGSNPTGDQGDYEFTYLKREGNTIFTTGTKTRNDIRFIAIEDTPEAYLAKVNEAKTALTGKMYKILKPANPTYTLTVNGKFLEYTEEGKATEKMALVHRPNGFRLYAPFKIGEVEVTEFTLNDTKDTLTSNDGSIELSVTTPMINFTGNSYAVLFRDNTVSAELFALYNQVKDANTARWGHTLSTFMLIEDNNGTIRFRMISDSRYSVGHQVEVKYDTADEVNFVMTTPDINWRYFPHIDPLYRAFQDQSAFKIEEAATDIYRLTSKANPNFVFLLIKN